MDTDRHRHLHPVPPVPAGTRAHLGLDLGRAERLRVVVAAGLGPLRPAVEAHGDGRYRCVEDVDGADVLVTDELDPDAIGAHRFGHPGLVILLVTPGGAPPARVAACLAAGADATAPATPRVVLAHLDALARRRALVRAPAG
jgi:hypothetical protein